MLGMNQKGLLNPKDMEGMVANIAGYRFVDLPDRDALREPFRAICKKAGLKGTILLSFEGINFFLAGTQSSVDQYLEFLEEDSRFSQIRLKYSSTEYQPFNRMNVRLKKEIISLGLDHVKPANAPEKRLRQQNSNSGWMKVEKLPSSIHGTIMKSD